MELGEKMEDAARREVNEETGIQVRIRKLLGIADHVVRDADGKIQFHYVLIDYLARPLTTSIKAQSDAAEAEWVRFKDLSDLPLTKGAKKLLQKVDDQK